jgi:branched-subunit amino acid aminotransferase/4-amino-4-deoxychorismate lyase
MRSAHESFDTDGRLELDGRMVTPPVACGLLAGTLREALLRERRIHEQVVRRDDLRRASRVWLVSSVRGWRVVDLVTQEQAHAPVEQAFRPVSQG